MYKAVLNQDHPPKKLEQKIDSSLRSSCPLLHIIKAQLDLGQPAGARLLKDVLASWEQLQKRDSTTYLNPTGKKQACLKVVPERLKHQFSNPSWDGKLTGVFTTEEYNQDRRKIWGL